MSRPPIINFSVRDRAGDTLIEADFPRLAAIHPTPRGAWAVLQAVAAGQPYFRG